MITATRSTWVVLKWSLSAAPNVASKNAKWWRSTGCTCCSNGLCVRAVATRAKSWNRVCEGGGGDACGRARVANRDRPSVCTHLELTEAQSGKDNVGWGTPQPPNQVHGVHGGHGAECDTGGGAGGGRVRRGALVTPPPRAAPSSACECCRSPAAAADLGVPASAESGRRERARGRVSGDRVRCRAHNPHREEGLGAGFGTRTNGGRNLRMPWGRLRRAAHITLERHRRRGGRAPRSWGCPGCCGGRAAGAPH